MGGLILSALVHPLFYGLLAYFLITGELLIPAESNVGAAFPAVAWVNLGGLSRALSARAQPLPMGEDAASWRGAAQIRVTSGRRRGNPNWA